MLHTELINYIIQKKKYKSYLEIGVAHGQNFDNIDIELKESCDVDNTKYNKLTYHMTSDEMFAKMPIDKKYDIIFIDGMHEEEFADRDIINSLKHLNEDGIVCVHDVIVPVAEMQVTHECTVEKDFWTGDVWKSITKLQDNNLEFYTVANNDFGLTIIKYKENPLSLSIPQHKSKIKYEYVFNNSYFFDTCLTEQGRYVLHIINENQLDKILSNE